MKNSIMYQKFWKNNLSIEKDFFQKNSFYETNHGSYLEKNKDLIFILLDIKYKSICIGANKELHKKISESFPFKLKNFESIKKSLNDKNYKLIYDDFDLYLDYQLVKPAPADLNFKLLKYNSNDNALINEFINSLNEEDKDILDLEEDFSSAEIWYFKLENQIVAVGSYFILKNNHNITDITLVTKEEFKNKKLASNILYAMLNDILDKNHIPRYRVAVDNLPSIKIAEKLGLSKYNRILAYSLC